MRRWVFLLPGVLAGLPAPQPRALAQAGAVLLQIRPKPGDTLRVRVDQTVEMARILPGEGTATASESGTMVLLTRLAIESVDWTAPP